MNTRTFTAWLRAFEDAAAHRQLDGDPDWSCRAHLDPAVARSIQRFQVGEDGDGAHLLANAERVGDAVYSSALSLFVAEEQNHARLLALLLTSAHASTLAGHWSDAVFVRLRRACGLRLELTVLMVAELIGLRYYRALRDGTGDPLTIEVARRVVIDEERHVPFHCQRLRPAFAAMPRMVRPVLVAAWRLLVLGATLTVAWDHGATLHTLGVSRRDFVADVSGLFDCAVVDILGSHPLSVAPVGLVA